MRGESGEVMVEYAIVTATAIVLFAAIIALSRPTVIGGWIEKTRDSFFVVGQLDNLKGMSREIQER